MTDTVAAPKLRKLSSYERNAARTLLSLLPNDGKRIYLTTIEHGPREGQRWLTDSIVMLRVDCPARAFDGVIQFKFDSLPDGVYHLSVGRGLEPTLTEAGEHDTNHPEVGILIETFEAFEGARNVWHRCDITSWVIASDDYRYALLEAIPAPVEMPMLGESPVTTQEPPFAVWVEASAVEYWRGRPETTVIHARDALKPLRVSTSRGRPVRYEYQNEKAFKAAQVRWESGDSAEIVAYLMPVRIDMPVVPSVLRGA